MDHRVASLKFLRATALIPVKVRPGQKDPFPEWDPRTVGQLDHSGTLLELERNTELNLGALFSGRYVDVDIDSDNPYLMAALDYFLPRTPYVWGRKSKPKSHRVYMLPEDFDRAPYSPILRYIKALAPEVVDDTSYSIEIRGGKPENGLFTVLPGSYRADAKEYVEWSSDIDPTVGGSLVDFDRLLRSVRLAISAAMVAPHWVEGVRNDMSMALAGTLYRIREASMAAFGLDDEEDAPSGYYVLTLDDAEAIFKCIMKLAADDENDQRTRLLNLRNTWRKMDAEAGMKITGGKVLASLMGEETGPKIVKALYRLLSDNDSAEALEKLSEQFVIWYGAGVLIDLEMVVNSRLVPWMTKEQARNSLGGKRVRFGDKSIPMAEILFSTTMIKRVHGMTFNPGTEELICQMPEGLMVNQWRGFNVEPLAQRVMDEEVDPFITYVKKILANGDEQAAHWIFSWLADLFKHPDKKPGTALVLVGVQGAGKTFLGEHIVQKIIGPNHSVSTNSVATLTNQFNTIIDNKVFCICNEAVHSYQKDAVSRLKSIITDRDLIVEPKGINSYIKPNHMRLVFTSNEEHAALFIDPSPHERRFTVLRVSDEFAANMDYWAMMHEWVPNNLDRIHRWLLDYHYERVLIMRPYETQAKRAIQRVGVEPEVSWIVSRVASGFLLGENVHRFWFEAFNDLVLTEADKKNNTLRRDAWPNRVVASTVEQDFKSFVRGHGKQVYSGSVITNIKRVLPEDSFSAKVQMSVTTIDPRTGQRTHKRERIYTFPTQEQIMAHLRRRYGEIVDEIYEAVVDSEASSHVDETIRIEDEEEY